MTDGEKIKLVQEFDCASTTLTHKYTKTKEARYNRATIQLLKVLLGRTPTTSEIKQAQI